MEKRSKAIKKTGTPAKPEKKSAVSNVLSSDADKPIPSEQAGLSYSFVNKAEYIPFLPGFDDYPQRLWEGRFLSTTHNACINTKRDYCAGDGFIDTEDKELPENIMEWLGNMNQQNEDINDLNKKIFDNFFTWGNVPIEIVRFTVGGKKKLAVYIHNLFQWRLGTPDDDDFVQYAIQSKLFLRNCFIDSDALKNSKNLPIYSSNKSDKDNWFKDAEKGVERTLIWYKANTTGFDYYGLPSAISSLIDQQNEYKSSRYNLDQFVNNLVPAFIVALKGSHTDQEVNKIARSINKTYAGDGKRGRTIVLASEQDAEISHIEKLETKTDGSFTEASRYWSEKIIMANQWDAILAGIVSPSTLGKGSGFITKIIEHKLYTVIRPAQRDVVDKVWRHIFKIADDWMGLGLDQFDLEIHNPIDVSGLGDIDPTAAVTIDEVRLSRGLPEIGGKEGKQFMKSSGPQPTDPNKGKEDKKDV